MFQWLQKTLENIGALTNPELVCHVSKTCNVLSPAFHKVQLASGTALQHLKLASKRC